MSTYCPVACAQDYEDSLPFITRLAHRFAIRNHVNVDDLIADANLIFIKAYTDPKWETCGMSWQGYLHQWLWMSWLDIYRPVFTRNGRHEFVEDLTVVADAYTTFDVDGLVESLTEDAAFVCKLVFDMPAEVRKAAEARGGEHRNYKSCVRQHLREMGWVASRITEAFDEIRSL